MHIILTHEQADFDALASLLGAHLLDESAIPVLPRRINRNVRSFLALYGVALPFLDPRDIPSEPISTVTLVDTQSHVSVKGMDSETRIHLIDHHPPKEGLPSDWSVIREELGATTTLLTEALRERDVVMSTVQATLLLLGIYEDTGSLTYTRTTARDLQAAAYLLEQGADLRIANNFLNHPLSHTQQKIYDQLRADAEHYHVHGFTVIITCGNAEGMSEELSSIAHKLRDVLDPEALFMLVTTRGGIQMIARSTSDNIDVAEILAHFGGGGHERAAAGLAKGNPLEELHQELVEILPKLVRPPITVAQIMSNRPQVLSPTTPVGEAAQRMQRYGYEGYPIVQNGKVVGLLTRRSVDRARSHNLNLTAASLMEAGEYSVHPEDSIELLKRIVTESGWGQIPVVDPEDGEIIGIVTRTDLLKTLSPMPKLPSRHNLAQTLEAALPPEHMELLKAIAQEASEQHVALYIVGGLVRDLIIKRPSLDFDLVVEGDSIELARALARRHGGRITSHSRFGTAKWLLPHPSSTSEGGLTIPDLHSVDLVSARTEFYTYPTALPTVERGSIKLDLHRRDFTINTLALRLDGHHYGELHDYWGGLEDLNRGLVRVLHSLSFVDDPTRMLRAVRFEQRFKFHIGERTLELMNEALSLLDRVSSDRIRHELNHIMIESCTPNILSRLDELNMLSTIHRDLHWDDWLSTRFEALDTVMPDPDWELTNYDSGVTLKRDLSYVIWLMRLSPEQVQDVCTRLKTPVDLTQVALAACKLWHKLPLLVEASPSDTVDQLEDLPALARYSVFLATSDIQLQRILLKYANRWRKIVPTITGHDLRARGLPPSPTYRYILKSLRDAWLDEAISTQEQENALLERFLGSQDTDVNIK